ncbi:hypothetical protein [Sphingobacterium faecale]|uniref:DUF4374 domain-containing protein n=1 Tax=Sphingobacterium faecale TaxID=2803775 RepID=A0ABS1R7S4_9SPHI|nr:hypothetical protein [Sphingobacterium faecale]MBL1410762.1 hypothetical protein [Sphingobacterium faecale]
MKLFFTSLYIGLLSVLGLLFSCTSPDTSTSFFPEYALYLLNEDGSNTFVLLDSLQRTGESVEIEVPSKEFTREYIQKKGAFYHFKEKNDYFIRYQLDSNHQMIATDSILFKDGYLENYLWKNDTDTLLLFTVEKKTTAHARMYVVDTKNFTLIREEALPLPSSVADFNLLSIGVVDFVDDKLWVAYCYSKFLTADDYTTSDTMYYATLDFSSLAVLNLQKDTRSSYPGGVNTVQSYSARDDQGDFYFMSCPGVALGNSLSKPTAIFRRKAGSQQVDTSYMLDVSKTILNHAYGFWYVGGQKAIIRSEQHELYTDFSNHHSVFQFEYYLVDLATKKLEKINIPLDKGTRKENVLVQGDYVYFGIDNESNKHEIWRYTPAHGKTENVFSASSTADYILRLDFLK